MRIVRKQVYEVDGKAFPSVAKARDHVESLIHHKLSRAMIERGFTISECVKVTDLVLAMRLDLAELLTCDLEEESEHD